MTSSHHTPHAYHADLTSVEINRPLSELDAAIETVITTGSGASTTLTAQAAAGQASLTVASSAGFTIGDPIYIGTGAMFESRIIATVPDATTITVTVNLSNTYASGKPVSKSPVEIVAARGTYTTLGGRIGPIESRVFDARLYGATGNGTTDDTAAIEAAAAAAATLGGTIYLAPGTYLVSWMDIPGFAGYKAGVVVRSGCTLRGAGMGATTIKLAASQPSYGSAGIVRNPSLNGGDERITIADLTVDGNGANQTTLYQGVDWERVRGVRHERVRVINVRGTADFPPGETFHFNAHSSTEVFYTDCEAQATAGTQGTGFGSNICTNVVRVNCISHGMSAGMGYADWYSRGVQMVNCIGQRNGSNGFNAEYCEDYILLGCRGGGRAATGATNYPWGTDASLGNGGSGFVINATTKAVLSGCSGEYNTNDGLSVVSTGTDRSQVQVIGGRYSNNANNGIYIADAESSRQCSVSPQTLMGGNLRDMSLQPTIGYVVDATSAVTAPALPATTVALVNDFPFDVTIYLSGGTVTVVAIDGATTGLTAGSFRVGPGRSITLTYSSAPTWVWSRR